MIYLREIHFDKLSVTPLNDLKLDFLKCIYDGLAFAKAEHLHINILIITKTTDRYSCF